jgi:hypothetical protein
MASTLFITSLKIAKRFHRIINPDASAFGRNWKLFSAKEYANELIFQYLSSAKPCMIGRFGSTEILCLTNYLGVKNPSKFKSYKSFIKSQTPPWWWDSSTINQIQQFAGFFPGHIDKIEQFCELMVNDIKEVDILGSWLKEERFFQKELSNAKRVVLEDIEPFFSPNPWTRALEGKKILVVHPFAETIEQQYKKRELLFENNLLPNFELKTIKAVQSIAGSPTEFSNWFEALESMKTKIDRTDYDICIIGAGAYGFPLAAHVKRTGKKAIHLAGVTQLLFGIKGKRWEQYIVWPYTNMYNEHWVRPGENEKPKNAMSVEGACYW